MSVEDKIDQLEDTTLLHRMSLDFAVFKAQRPFHTYLQAWEAWIGASIRER